MELTLEYRKAVQAAHLYSAATEDAPTTPVKPRKPDTLKAPNAEVMQREKQPAPVTTLALVDDADVTVMTHTPTPKAKELVQAVRRARTKAELCVLPGQHVHFNTDSYVWECRTSSSNDSDDSDDSEESDSERTNEGTQLLLEAGKSETGS